LRDLGFGYRSKYIIGTAKKLLEMGGESALVELREKSTNEAHSFLTKLPGVGSKVASCVCLFSLDKHEDIPVDTHVWQIAIRDFKMDVKGKSLTKKVYKEIGDEFRRRFGIYAGWAHNVMFVADLTQFSHRLPPELRSEGDSSV